MNKARSPWTWLLAAILVLPTGSYVVFRISLLAIAEVEEGWHPAWFGNSSYANIIVLVPDNSAEGFSAELIPLSSASNYPSEHPGSTFLIPIDRQSLIQEQLKANLKLSWTTFEVKKLSDAEEEVTLYFMDRTDDSHGSRYRATKDHVQLKSYRYVSDRGGIGVLLLALMLTLALDVLVVGAFLARAIYVGRRTAPIG